MRMKSTGKPPWTPLIDVTRVPVAELLRPGTGPLAACVERLLEDLEDPDGVISAFGNVPATQ